MGLFDIFKKKQKVDIRDTYMARDLRELEDAISTTLMPTAEDREAYLYKLFFTPIEQGGLGLPVERRDEIMGGYIKEYFYTILDRFSLYVKGDIERSYMYDYAKLFFSAGLREPGTAEMVAVMGRINAMCGKVFKDAQAGVDSFKRFYREVLNNPKSFLYNKKLYEGDVKCIESKCNFCFNIFYLEEHLYVRDQITLDEVLSVPSKEALNRLEQRIVDPIED